MPKEPGAIVKYDNMLEDAGEVFRTFISLSNLIHSNSAICNVFQI